MAVRPQRPLLVREPAQVQENAVCMRPDRRPRAERPTAAGDELPDWLRELFTDDEG
jgi:hypothetical protein